MQGVVSSLAAVAIYNTEYYREMSLRPVGVAEQLRPPYFLSSSFVFVFLTCNSWGQKLRLRLLRSFGAGLKFRLRLRL